MAEELRYETLKGTMLSGQTQQDDLARFVNETGKDISIRIATLTMSGNGMDAGDSAVGEMSKDPTISSNVNNDTTPRIQASIRAPEQLTAGTTSGGSVDRRVQTYAKGQWVLRPGEDLHLNVSKTSTTSGQIDGEVWWHVN